MPKDRRAPWDVQMPTLGPAGLEGLERWSLMSLRATVGGGRLGLQTRHQARDSEITTLDFTCSLFFSFVHPRFSPPASTLRTGQPGGRVSTRRLSRPSRRCSSSVQSGPAFLALPHQRSKEKMNAKKPANLKLTISAPSFAMPIVNPYPSPAGSSLSPFLPLAPCRW